MIKKIFFRLEQTIMYCLVNLIILMRISKKIYVPGCLSPINIRPKSTDLLTFHQIFTFKEYDMNLKVILNS